MSVEQVRWGGLGETVRAKLKYSEKIRSQCQLCQLKFHVNWSEIEAGSPRWEVEYRCGCARNIVCPVYYTPEHRSFIAYKAFIHSLQRGQVAKLAWPRWREVAAQKIWPVPEAVVTVFCTPDDGCGWHPKHVEWTRRIINRLLCVASRWIVINIHQRCAEP